ncbi:MAG: hypothetical protein U9M97_03120, partial [Candidatus Hadarchaeota archaeon]|nr:hypothetical protein [Candidatus Hadarchaeota archaeon]
MPDREYADIRELKGRKYAYVGKTFASSERLEAGDVFLLEAETINHIIDYDKDTRRITAWVPNMIKGLEAGTKPDSIRTILTKAQKAGVLQQKIIEGGETR